MKTKKLISELELITSLLKSGEINKDYALDLLKKIPEDLDKIKLCVPKVISVEGGG